MLKYALMAIAAALAVAVVVFMLPTGGGPRPEPKLLAAGDPQSSTSFTVRDAAPPVPVAPSPAAAPAPPARPGDLDAVMQRLRNGAAAPDATPAPPGPAVPPVPAPAPVAAAPDPAAAPPPNPPSPPNRWASVTSSGTRWRMARSGSGFTVSIDLGGGQVADVHVQSAFANLDPAAVNVRVDYLRDTILQNFSNHSGSYNFARDGSVAVDR